MTRMELKERLEERAGMLAFAVAAVVFLSLSLSAHRPPKPMMVPVVRQNLPPGARITRQDIRFVRSTAMRPVNTSALLGYSRTALFTGEILSPTAVGRAPSSNVVVAVTPTDGADANVATVGNPVDILVVGSQGQLIWQSGPAEVAGVTNGVGVRVMLTLTRALTFERISHQGRVELVGIER